MNKIFKEISEFVDNLEIVDTHEHLPPKENQRNINTDILKEYLDDYFGADLISAGLSKDDFLEVTDISKSITKRWELVEPYWKAARHTGYGRALEISIRELYGIKEVSAKTIEKLNNEFKRSLTAGHFAKVLKQKSKIKISLLDKCGRPWEPVVDCDKRFFRNVLRLDNFVYPKSREKVEQIEKGTKIKIDSFEQWLEACRVALDQAIEGEVVALKSALAYERSIKYEKVKKEEAKEVFDRLIKNKATFPTQIIRKGRKFQDFMMHYILGLANKREMVFQFHTGIQARNGNILSRSDPSLLNNLFLEYPKVKFDIFHIGYPYQSTLAALAKMFPNVYIDMCWVHIISPHASVDALEEFIDTVPINKISAFGGDYGFIDGVYGHQRLARINVSKALTRKVEEGVLDLQGAKEIAEMIFFANPNKLFKLNL